MEAATRGQIPPQMVNAALGCLTDYGVAKTSLTDVARRANVSRTTAYRCFGSKNGMLNEVARIEVERYLERLDAALEAGREPTEAMRLGIKFTLKYIREHALLQRIFRDEPEEVIHLVVERADSPEIVNTLSEATAAILAKWVDQNQLSVPFAEAGEWIVRSLYTFMLLPSTRIADPDRVSSMLLTGIAARPRG